MRTTETGGTKLIYNGVPVSGECTATTGTDTQLASTSNFNSSINSPAYVGYMYGTIYTYSFKSSSKLATSYKYGNSFGYNGSSYILVDTIDSSGDWVTDYNTLNNNHYTCFNTTGTCSSLYYIYYTTSSRAYYITLTNGKSVEQALDEMFTNTTSSVIKTAIDSWYTTNLGAYEASLEDTVWCNDREIYQLGGWDANGGNTVSNYELYFASYKRVTVTYYPSLKCNPNDSFTKNSGNGNGKLANPIGLITSDEAMLAGGRQGTGNSTYYLYINQFYWLGSPNFFSGNALEWHVPPAGHLNSANVNNTYGVRPSVSLKPGGTWSGSGTSSDPYTVSYS